MTYLDQFGDPQDLADYTPADEPTVAQILELSTGHAPDADAYREWIQERSAMSRAEGDLLHVALEPDLRGDPDWLKAIHAHARDLDCAWILFDADAPIDPELPFWPW